MTESGGTTTQSGIYYQNSITALYLGALLDMRPPPGGSSRIISVRAEAPEDIDDTVVRYENGATLYIQAKESLSTHGDAWEKFWSSAEQQAKKSLGEKDKFLLVLGTLGLKLENLRETLERAQGKESIIEWKNSLNREHTKIANSILGALTTSDDNAFSIIRRTRAEFVTINTIEQSGAREWMPAASEDPVSLHGRLRDCCGGLSRSRHTFRASELAEMLLAKFQIRLLGNPSDGLEQYRLTISEKTNQIGVPGTSISVNQDELIVWPTIVSPLDNKSVSFDDESPRNDYNPSGEEVDLNKFPSSNLKWVVLESGAGHGKSTLIRATVSRLASETTIIPVLIRAEELQEQVSIHKYLDTEYNSRYGTSIDWTTLSLQGRLALFIDGIDEVNDSARSAIIEMIALATSRFTELSVLIGARDSAIASLPPKFRLLRLQRLDDEQSTELLRKYFKIRRRGDIQAIINHVHAYEELHLLCRIPLFLALFAATLPASGPIPTSRCEVLEHYILHATSPERSKGASKLAIGKSQLRLGAESLALLSLERNEAALPEFTARNRLASLMGDIAGEDCVDSLIRHGLLERRGPRVTFSIPTIQEYLAGCALAIAGRLNSDDWLDNVYRRPWAQAIQFAIEKVENADTLLRRQIEREDDIFFTSLRLAARCVANGATIKDELRDIIASKLAIALIKSGSITRDYIGNLILDGFLKPLHPDIRRALVNTSFHLHERPRIVSRISDDSLTMECLKEILRRNDVRELWNPNWHQALRGIAKDAVPLLIERARNEQPNSLTTNVIAETIYHLGDSGAIDWSAFADDHSIHTPIRCAAAFCAKKYPEERLQELTELALNDSGHEIWYSFTRAYTERKWWSDHFLNLCQRSPSENITSPLSYLSSDRDSELNNEVISTLEKAATNELTDENCRRDIVCILSAIGLYDFSIAAIKALATTDIRGVHAWIAIIPYLPDDLIEEGVTAILSREWSNDDLLSVIQSLHHSAGYKAESSAKNIGLRGPFIKLKSRRKISSKMLHASRNLLDTVDILPSDKAKLLLCNAEHGDVDSFELLKRITEDYLISNIEISTSVWNDWLGTSLMSDEFITKLSTKILWNIIEKGMKLPMYRIVEEIISREGSDSYKQLVEFSNDHRTSTARQAFLFYLERNAAREGLIVQIRQGKLELTRVI
ncbi:TPA: hypothetical protein UL939_003983 [Stenotrophomonas maltophilia]|nr:hypothetical protein [Stenotrophomonas maltophilia]HEL2969057.1 hypothetical protein [Stenotrophomonas maltophilia]